MINDDVIKENKEKDNFSTTTSNKFKKLLRNNSTFEKENMYINLLQKQNLLEIKILIDNKYKRREKSLKEENRKNKLIEKEEELLLQRKLKNDIKFEEDLHKNQEMIEKEINELKQNGKEYNNYIKKQIEEEKKEEEKQKQLGKEDLKRKLILQKNEDEYKLKVDNINKEKHNLLLKKYLSMEKKNEERLKKLEERKKKVDEKFKNESKLRNEKYQNFLLEREKQLKETEDKFNEKQKQIQKNQEIQKRKKEFLLKQHINKRDEYKRHSLDLKQNINDYLNEKRKKCIFHLVKTEKRVNSLKENNEKLLLKKKNDNLIKEDILNNQLKEYENQIQNKNILYLKKLKEKNLRIDEMKKKQKEIIEQARKIKDSLRNKKLNMIRNTEKLFESGKFKDKNDIYNKIFSQQDLSILSNSIYNSFNFTQSLSTKNIFSHNFNGKNKNLEMFSFPKQCSLKKKKYFEFND